MGTSVQMDVIPECDVCKEQGFTVKAKFDARLPKMGGSWGYVCQHHFDLYGPGQLGTGHGQELVERKPLTHAE